MIFALLFFIKKKTGIFGSNFSFFYIKNFGQECFQQGIVRQRNFLVNSYSFLVSFLVIFSSYGNCTSSSKIPTYFLFSSPSSLHYFGFRGPFPRTSLPLTYFLYPEYTEQYRDFNALIDKNIASGNQLSILAFPCNQFGQQEPAENREILNGRFGHRIQIWS